MSAKFIASLKKLKPTSKEAVKTTLARGRPHSAGVVAFQSDVVSPKSSYDLKQLKKLRSG